MTGEFYIEICFLIPQRVRTWEPAKVRRAAAVAPTSAAVASDVAAPPAERTSAARGAAPADDAYVLRGELACSANNVSGDSFIVPQQTYLAR